MAQLPPKAVFGAAHLGQAVHVLFLIENSLAMLDHWSDLQQHILPGVLGAVRLANAGIDVQVFCMTTGKTEGTRDPEQVPQKSQRQFNDFPDIDIVNIPRNRMSATFIRQSIDMFLGGPTSAPHLPVTRHLFLVAMSSPVDDIGSPQSPTMPISTGAGTAESTDAIWDAVCQKLQENDICLHVIANPVVRLSRIFDVFRKTMRAQSRQEVIPWQPVDNTHCICHLSGSNRYRKEKREYPIEEWPEMNLPVSAPPSPRPGSPTDGSEDDQQYAYMSPMELINDNLSRAAAAAVASNHNTPSSPYGSSSAAAGSGVGAGMSLVSRMQAIHGLANRRRPGERTRSRRSAFFRDAAPAAGPPSPSPRRERLRSLGSMSMAIGAGAGPSSSTVSSLSLFTGIAGSPYPSPLTSTGTEHHHHHHHREQQQLGAARTGRSRHHSLSSTSALDLQGLANSGATFASFHQLNSGVGVGAPGNVPYPIDTSSSLLSAGGGGLGGGTGAGILPPSSPASDTSGSASALSNSFVSLPPHHTQTQTHQQQQQQQLSATQIGHQPPNANLYPPTNPYTLSTNVSPLHAHFPGPFSHISTHHALQGGHGGYHSHPHPHASPTLTQTFHAHTPLHSPTHMHGQGQMHADAGGGGGGGFALSASAYGPAPQQQQSCYFGPIGPSGGVAPSVSPTPRLGSESAFAAGPRGGFPQQMSNMSVNMGMDMDVHADGYGGPQSGERSRVDSGGEDKFEGRGEGEGRGEEVWEREEEEVVPASAPPDARDQRPFVFDASYEARSALKLRQAVGEMAVQGLSSPPLPPLSSHPHPLPQGQSQGQYQQQSPPPPIGLGATATATATVTASVSGTVTGGYGVHPAPASASAPSLEASRSTSSTFSDSSTSASLPGGRAPGLALDESWKGHSIPNPSITTAQSEIPELPETFYEPSRAGHGARLAERGAGVRRSTYGPS